MMQPYRNQIASEYHGSVDNQHFFLEYQNAPNLFLKNLSHRLVFEKVERIMKFPLAIFSFFIILINIEARSVNERQKRPLIQLEFPSPILELELYFNCNDNKFISRDLVCDGHNDCKSGADEEFCEQNQLVHLRQ